MSECNEIAANMNPPQFSSFDDAARWVREQMPDETTTIVDNIAESLMKKVRCAKARKAHEEASRKRWEGRAECIWCADTRALDEAGNCHDPECIILSNRRQESVK